MCGVCVCPHKFLKQPHLIIKINLFKLFNLYYNIYIYKYDLQTSQTYGKVTTAHLSYNCDHFPLELQLFYRHRKSVGWRPGMVVHALQPGLAYLTLQEANFKTILKN